AAPGHHRRRVHQQRDPYRAPRRVPQDHAPLRTAPPVDDDDLDQLHQYELGVHHEQLEHVDVVDLDDRVHVLDRKHLDLHVAVHLEDDLEHLDVHLHLDHQDHLQHLDVDFQDDLEHLHVHLHLDHEDQLQHLHLDLEDDLEHLDLHVHLHHEDVQQHV